MFQTAKTTLVVLCAIVGLLATVATAQTTFTASSGDYFDAANWDNGVPGFGNTGTIDSGEALGTPDGSNYMDNHDLIINGGKLNSDQGWKMRNSNITQNGGLMEQRLFVGWGQGAGAGTSTYTLNDGQISIANGMHIGRFQPATFNQNGGTVTVLAHPAGRLMIGEMEAATYNLAGGILQTDRFDIEQEANAVGNSFFNFTEDSTGVLYVLTNDDPTKPANPGNRTAEDIVALINNGIMTIGGLTANPSNFAITELTSGPFSGFTSVSSNSSPLLGDFNDDSVINELDFGILRDHMQGHFENAVGYANGDIDVDGDVDLDDFGYFKDLYPEVVANALGIPEPSSITLSLWALAGVALRVRHRGHRAQ